MRRSVETYLHLPRSRYFSAIEMHAVAIGSIAAAVLLIGYGFNFEPLQTLIPGFPSMRPRTAGLLMALSLSCLLSLRASRRSQILSSVIAAGVVVYVVYLIATAFFDPAIDPASLLRIQGTAVSVVLAGKTATVGNLFDHI